MKVYLFNRTHGFIWPNWKMVLQTAYFLKDQENGIYTFLISGKIEINGQQLEARDGYGIWPDSEVGFKAIEDSFVLVMEVPERK
jgi:redox-sensitive bicupin YhaK (pirin superfamily)